MRRIARRAIWGLAVITAVMALYATSAYGATSARASRIDLNAPTASRMQCMPCHAEIGDSTEPGLIFSHGAHMTTSCDTCHRLPAHTGGVTIVPEMSTCFSCHGLKHGAREIARSDCKACHTADWNRRPASHVSDWKKKSHATAAKADANSCLMCHTSKSCDACHSEQAPDAPPTQLSYRPVLKGIPRRPAVSVMPKGQVTMGQCVNCHPDLDDFLPGRVIFAHAVHLQRAFACLDCHQAFPHGPDTTTRPTMQACYQCHGLTHASLGKVATDRCEDCHPKDFGLKPSDHTPAFVRSGHKLAANAKSEECAMCHAASFCSDCHQGKPARPGGPPRKKVVPADHKLRSFRTLHGKHYLKQRGACGSCHESAQCEACHSTPMPHPADWTTTHALAKGLDSEACRVCHTDRQRCQECHHGGVRGRELIAGNCVGCHPVMKTKPATTIRNKGFAEHAVHFDVATKTSRKKPYRCEDCHVGFGFSSTARTPEEMSALNQGHDLRLCYECHGALDAVTSVRIAPYPGNALCLRCHTNI